MLRPLCFFVAVFAAAAPLQAQYGYGQGALTGAGTVTIERQPELMRMHVQILATAPTMKDALAALKTRAESATAQVVALGAAKDSVKLQPATTVETGNDRNRQMQMQMMMRQRLQGQAGKKKGAAKVAEPVRLAATFSADWRLNAKTHEELLAAVHDVQQKLKSLDLAGAKEANKLSPEEQELLEEAEAQYGEMYMDGGEDPSKPRFLFLAQVSDADYDRALAEAFQKASAQAQRLARAAGRGLGELQSVSTHDGYVADDESEVYSRYGQAAYNMLQRYRQRQGLDESLQAIGVVPGPVKLHVTVTASYAVPQK